WRRPAASDDAAADTSCPRSGAPASAILLEQAERHHEAEVVRDLPTIPRDRLDRRGTLRRLECELDVLARHVAQHLEEIARVETDVEGLAVVLDLQLFGRLSEIGCLDGEAERVRVEAEPHTVRLVTRDDRHSTERLGELVLVRDRVLVVVTRDDLLVIRVRPLDQSRVDLRTVLPEAEVVFAACDLDLVIGAEEALHLG